MAAGFLITRILLVFLYLSDLSYSSALQTAWRDGGQKLKVNGYTTRRPLHHIRALRQSNINEQPDNGVKMWQNPSQGRYPSDKPRNFELNRAVPLFDILGLNERISSGSKDSAYGNDGTEPRQYKQNRARIQSNLKFPGSDNLWNKDATKDPDGRKIGQGVSKPSFQLGFSLPSPDESLMPSKSEEHFTRKFVQNRYPEPAKLQSALTRTGIRLPPLIRKGSLHEQVQQQLGSKWPVLNTADAGHKQTQSQVFEAIYTEPIDGKSWHSGQHTSPQWITQDKTPIGNGWRSQKTVVTKPPPLPIPNYPQYVYSAYTTSPRKDYDKNQMSQPDPRKLHLSPYPQQNDKVPKEGSDLFRERNVAHSPSGVQIQSRYNTPGSNLLNASKKDTNGGKNEPEILKSSFQLSLVVPIPLKSRDLTKNNKGHFAQHTGSVNAFMKPTKLQSSSTLTGSNWPLNLDTKHEKMHRTELKWPALNPDTGYKQTQQPAYEPFQPKPTEGTLTYSTLHSSQYTSPQQISQDKTPTGQSWGGQKPLNLDTKHEKMHRTELKWPALNPDTGYKQTQQPAYEPFQPKPTEGTLTYSTLHSSQYTSPQQISQDKTPTGQSWGGQKPLNLDTKHEKMHRTELKWPALNPDTGYKQTQQPAYEPFQPKPTEGTLTYSTLHSSHYTSPQQISQDKTPTGQSWGGQKPLNLDTKHEKMHQTELKWPALNPDTGYKQTQQPAYEPFQPKPTEGTLTYSTLHSSQYTSPQQISQDKTPTGQSWGGQKPLNLDTKHEKMHRTELKWPALNPDTGYKQTQQPAYEPFQPKPTEGTLTYSTLHSSHYTSPQQISQDKTPTGQSWGFQKPSVTNYPPLPIQEYPQHTGINSVHTSLPRKPILPRPSQSENLYYSADVKPNGNDYVQGLTHPPTGSPLTFAYERYGSRFKPYIDQTQSGDTGHRYSSVIPYDLPSISPPKWEETTTNYEAGKVQKWQKPTSFPYQYSIRHETSYDVSNPLSNPFAPSTDYQTQDRFFGKDTDEPKLNGKHKIPKLIIDQEGGDDGIAGQAYFAAKVVHDDGVPGKNKAEMPINSNTPFVNLQTRVSVKKDALKELFKSPSLNKKPQPNLQIPCVDGADCSHMPEKQRQTYRFPEQDKYSPYIDANPVFVPTNQQYLAESSSNPIQNILIRRRYDVDNTQPTSYM